MGNSLRITPLTMYQIDNTCYDGLKACLPKRPTNNRGYEDLLLTGFDVDGDIFINNMLAELAEMQIIYTQPDFFKFAVNNWALKEKDIWQRLYDTVFYKYNPIWNKDGTIKDTGLETRNLANSTSTTGENENSRVIANTETTEINDETNNTNGIKETMSDTRTIDEDTTNEETRNLSGSDNETKNLTMGHTNSKSNTGTQTNQGTDNTTNSVSAYNDTGFVNRDKSENATNNTRTDNLTEQDRGENTETGTDNHVSTETGTIGNIGTRDVKDEDEYTKDIAGTNNTIYERNGTATNNGTITDTSTNDSSTNGTETGTIGNTLTRIEQGNIGVTTTQQMIEAERQLVKFNIYDVIIDSFKQRFCLLLY